MEHDEEVLLAPGGFHERVHPGLQGDVFTAAFSRFTMKTDYSFLVYLRLLTIFAAYEVGC